MQIQAIGFKKRLELQKIICSVFHAFRFEDTKLFKHKVVPRTNNLRKMLCCCFALKPFKNLKTTFVDRTFIHLFKFLITILDITCLPLRLNG